MASSQTPTRLVIRDIDVENFKSYAGQHRIGPFHKTFSCVIGPNGSGKSNVIDAMLFVFGKSAKKIRLEKLSELIHNSAAFPDLSYASVTVNFVEVRETEEDSADPQQRLEMPGTEVCVKREVHRNNASQYYINGARCTQKEVVTMLTGRGVDLDHNRFLILQGEVEQISLMKPKAEKEGEEGLLEYLDDLIGTNQYVEKINEATVAFDQVQEERLNGLDELRRAEADRSALDDAKSSAMVYVTKENHLQSLMIVLVQIKRREIEKLLVVPRQKIAELSVKLSEIDHSVAAKNDEIVKMKKEETKGKVAVENAKKEREAVKSKKMALEEDLAKEKASSDEQDKQKKRENDKLKKLKDEVNDLQVKIQSVDMEVRVKETQVEEEKQLRDKLHPEHEAATERLAAQKKPLMLAMEAKKKALMPFARQVQEAKENLETANERLTHEDEKRNRLRQDLEKAAQDRERLNQKVRDNTEMLANAERDTTTQRIQALREKLKGTTERKLQINSAIEDHKKQFRDGAADERIADFLLSQRDIKGYYGTLRQLGKIDDEYDVAAGMCSNHWGHLVVEDKEAAAMVLDRLKQHGKGRATVVCLKEVRNRVGEKMDKKFVAPDGSVRLYDLIKPLNEKFLPAFYNAVVDTLVVSDIGAARRVAFGGSQRHRVVTMKGDLVETNGTVSGGGAPRPAKLKAARLPQDQNLVKETLTRLQTELREAVDGERGVREELEELERKQQQSSLTPEQLRRLRAEINQSTSHLTAIDDKCDKIAKELERIEHSKEHQQMRRSLIASVEECRAAVETAESTQLQYKNAVQELEAQLDAVGGEEYKALSIELKTITSKLANSENALREARKNSQKLKASKEKKEHEVVEVQLRLEALKDDSAERHKEEIARLRSAIDALDKDVLKHDTKVSVAEGQLEHVKQDIANLEEAIRNFGKEKDEVNALITEHQGSITSETNMLNRLQGRIELSESKIRDNIRSYGIETFDFKDRLLRDKAEIPQDDDEEPANAKKRARDDESSESGDSDDDYSTSRRNTTRANTRDDEQENATREPTEEELMAIPLQVPEHELDQYDLAHSSHLAKSLTEECDRLKLLVNLDCVARWREKDIIYRRAKNSYDTIRQRLDFAEHTLLELKTKRKTEFMECFTTIQRKVKEMYQMLTHGGDAEVELVDTQDPFEGVNFLLRPPKKSWKQVSNLSGGEKTLASLALVFALHHVRPTPVYVMDEIDAALDFRNVSIVANYVLRSATGAQFIIISLRNNMFELAHQLVGICKVRDVTRSLTLNPSAMQSLIEHMMLTQRKRGRGSLQELEYSASKPRPSQ